MRHLITVIGGQRMLLQGELVLDPTRYLLLPDGRLELKEY